MQGLDSEIEQLNDAEQLEFEESVSDPTSFEDEEVLEEKKDGDNLPE